MLIENLSLNILKILFILLIFLSVKKRVTYRRYRANPLDKINEPRTSYFSEGLINLIGTAGGIYLALITTINFLQINFPERIIFYGLSIEPIAGISYLIAILQPYVLSIIGRFK